MRAAPGMWRAAGTPVMTRREVLAGVMLAAGLAPSRPVLAVRKSIVIVSDALETLGAYGLGVRLGAREAERTAMLLERDFRLVHTGPALARVARRLEGSHQGAVVAMSGTSTAPCQFVTESAEDVRAAVRTAAGASDVAVDDWHPGFRRYGAGELNERFLRTFGTPMTTEAWHGWVAVKAITEAALRGDDICAELAHLRFDGHKGRALTFDPTTRRLRHPVLLVRGEGDRITIEVAP